MSIWLSTCQKTVRVEFAVPVGLLFHIEAAYEVIVIVRQGEHVGFVGIAKFKCWRDKS